MSHFWTGYCVALVGAILLVALAFQWSHADAGQAMPVRGLLAIALAAVLIVLFALVAVLKAIL